MKSARGVSPYQPPDPTFGAYDRGIGTLSLDGEVVGHLASRVLDMSFPSRQPWLWFLIVWLDGSREPKFEDYGPDWWIARELDSGRFDHFRPSVIAERKLLGFRFEAVTRGEPVVFDFEWLSPEMARAKWFEFGLTDADF